MVIRRLLDGERFDHDGPRYTFRDALCAPRPIQERLPILIGGSGRRKTLRTVAERADAWNASTTPDELRELLDVLQEHADAAGRDLSSLEITASFPLILDDDPRAARTRLDALMAANGTDDLGTGPQLLGSPEVIADALRPYRDLGVSTVIVRMPGPFDRQTIERIGEVNEALGA
jgi:alkanesulfonate monooxygenase SsuD/methylene tetrahydromethanopterin reductase-like flavin-dependent oxidoreductase (luciferase family)